MSSNLSHEETHNYDFSRVYSEVKCLGLKDDLDMVVKFDGGSEIGRKLGFKLWYFPIFTINKGD